MTVIEDIQMQNNEILLSLQTMLMYLESGSLSDYESEKKHYDELKEKRTTQKTHPFRDIPSLIRRSFDDKIPLKA